MPCVPPNKGRLKKGSPLVGEPFMTAGAPGATRTRGTGIRNPLLYPPELRGRSLHLNLNHLFLQAKNIWSPEFPGNTGVPERHLQKRWGTPEGEQVGESPALRAGKGPREGHRESI